MRIGVVNLLFKTHFPQESVLTNTRKNVFVGKKRHTSSSRQEKQSVGNNLISCSTTLPPLSAPRPELNPTRQPLAYAIMNYNISFFSIYKRYAVQCSIVLACYHCQVI